MKTNTGFVSQFIGPCAALLPRVWALLILAVGAAVEAGGVALAGDQAEHDCPYGGLIAVVPQEYTQLQYVQGDGGAYVDISGFKLSSEDTVVAKLSVAAVENAIVFGSRQHVNGGHHDDAFMFDVDATEKMSVFYRNDRDLSSSSLQIVGYSKFLDHLLWVEMGANQRVVEDIDDEMLRGQKGDFISASFESLTDLRIFGGTGDVWVKDHMFTGRIYSFVVWRAGLPRLVLVPVQNNAGEVGFYDAVSGQFYGNSSNVVGASLTAGPESSTNVFADIARQAYTGHPIKPVKVVCGKISGQPCVLLEGDGGFTASYLNNVDSRMASVTVSYLDGEDEVQATASFEIAHRVAFVGNFMRDYVVERGRRPFVRDVSVVVKRLGEVLDQEDYVLSAAPCYSNGFASVMAVVTNGEYKGEKIQTNVPVWVLPPGYKAIEYVQGDGTAYVDLKTQLSNLDALTTEFLIPEVENAMIYGTRNSNSSNSYLAGIDDDGYLAVDFHDGSAGRVREYYKGRTVDMLNHRMRVQVSAFERRITDLDGTTVYLNTGIISQSFTTEKEVWLFGGTGKVWGEPHKFCGRVYSFKLERNGEPRMLLLPCKRRNKVGFYDFKSGTFFGNAAEAGAFSAGPLLWPNSQGLAILLY